MKTRPLQIFKITCTTNCYARFKKSPCSYVHANGSTICTSKLVFSCMFIQPCNLGKHSCYRISKEHFLQNARLPSKNLPCSQIYTAITHIKTTMYCTHSRECSACEIVHPIFVIFLTFWSLSWLKHKKWWLP